MFERSVVGSKNVDLVAGRSILAETLNVFRECGNKIRRKYFNELSEKNTGQTAKDLSEILF